MYVNVCFKVNYSGTTAPSVTLLKLQGKWEWCGVLLIDETGVRIKEWVQNCNECMWRAPTSLGALKGWEKCAVAHTRSLDGTRVCEYCYIIFLYLLLHCLYSNIQHLKVCTATLMWFLNRSFGIAQIYMSFILFGVFFLIVNLNWEWR